MDIAALAQVKLIGLKIAMKIHKGSFKTKEGKISSTELLKTADEINNYLLKDFRDSSGNTEGNDGQVITKKENAELIQEVTALKKVIAIMWLNLVNENPNTSIEGLNKVFKTFKNHQEFENRNTLIDQPNWIVNKAIDLFLIEINQNSQNRQSQESLHQ